MPQFEFSTYYSQIFWLILTFGLLYLIVCRFISPAAENIFKNRHSTIENEINEASEIALRAEELRTEYDIEFDNIADLTDKIKKEAKVSLDASLALKMVTLEEELNIQAKKTFDEISEATKRFLHKEMEASLNLAGFITEKITHKKANEELLKKCYEKVK